MELPLIYQGIGAHLAALGLSVETVPPSRPLRRGIAANLLLIDKNDEDSPSHVAAHVIALDDSPEAQTRPYQDGERIVLGTNPLKWQSAVRACAMTLESQRSSPSPSPGTAPAPVAPTPARSTPSTGAGTGRILIAEDHPVNQALAQRQLTLLGWSCDVVGNGRAAYEALCRNDYALLMTDCQMPEMDGYELASAWRRLETAEQRTPRLPIIAMTAHALGDEIARCRDAGMDDYLSKPVQLKALQEKLDSWLRPAGLADESNTLPATGTETTTRADMLRLLRETSEADLDAIEQAMAVNETATVERRLHRMLGALEIFIDGPGIDHARQLLDELHRGDTDRPLEELPSCLAGLREQLEQLVPAVDQQRRPEVKT